MSIEEHLELNQVKRVQTRHWGTKHADAVYAELNSAPNNADLSKNPNNDKVVHYFGQNRWVTYPIPWSLVSISANAIVEIYQRKYLHFRVDVRTS